MAQLAGFEQITAMIHDCDWDTAAAALGSINVSQISSDNWENYEQFTAEIPEETAVHSSGICRNMVRLQSGKGQKESAEQWLTAFKSNLSSQAAPVSPYDLLSAQLALPRLSSAQMIQMLLTFFNNNQVLEAAEQPLSITGGRPSVLRGSKDLSEWGRFGHAVAQLLSPAMEHLLPQKGAGICEAVLAEILYEKNRNDQAKELLQMVLSGQHAETAFSIYAIMARIALQEASGLEETWLKKIKELAESPEGEHLKPNAQAFEARCVAARGDMSAASDWAAAADVKRKLLYPLKNSYILLTYISIHIQMGQYDAAKQVLQPLLELLQQEHRPLDLAECLTLDAIVQYYEGRTAIAQNEFIEALKIIHPYGYLRVIADMGNAVLPIIQKLTAEEKIDGVPRPYLLEIETVAQAIAARSQLSLPDNVSLEEKTVLFSEEEQQIIDLIAEGLTDIQIAQKIASTPKGVKRAVAGIMSKLGVKKREEIPEAFAQSRT